MLLDELAYFFRSGEVSIEIVGTATGDLMVRGRRNHIDYILLNRYNGQPKLFREPKTVLKQLSKVGITHYGINLSDWDETMIFDRHKAAVRSRVVSCK